MQTRSQKPFPDRHIMVPTGYVARLANTFGVSRITIYSAFYYKTQSVTAERIRNLALQIGGHVYEPKPQNNQGNENRDSRI